MSNSTISAEDIVKKLKEWNVSHLDLDELVHECKGEEAASINNGGMVAQVEYLISSGVTLAMMGWSTEDK